MATLLEIKQGILRRLAWKDDKVGLLPIPLTATTTAANALGIRDTALARGTHGAGNYNGRHVEIVETVTGSPTLGSVAAVDVGGFDLTDLITTSPAFDDEVQAGTDWLMYPKLLVPETVRDAINNVLKKTEAPHLWAPSLVTDSDMGANALTNWDAIGSPTTRAFVTTAAHVYFGPRALHLADADTDEGAQTEYFGVYDTESLLVSVLARVVVGTLNVILYRVTATAVAVKTVTLSLREPQYSEVRFRQTVPSGMRQGQLQFVAPEDNCEFYISPHVIVQSDRRRSYTVPSWLVSESQVVELVELPAGASADDDDSYIPLSSNLRSMTGLDFIRSDRDVNPLRIEFRNPGSNPVYLLCKRPFAELSILTEETNCDEEFVVAKATAKILKDRGDAGWWVHDREAERRARKMGYGGRELRSESPTVLV